MQTNSSSACHLSMCISLLGGGEHGHSHAGSSFQVVEEDDEDEYDDYLGPEEYYNHNHHQPAPLLPPRNTDRDAHNKCCNNYVWCVRVSRSGSTSS